MHLSVCGSAELHPLFPLLVHHLQLPSICKLSSSIFYDNQLLTTKNLTSSADPGLANFWPNGMKCYTHVHACLCTYTHTCTYMFGRDLVCSFMSSYVAVHTCIPNMYTCYVPACMSHAYASSLSIQSHTYF